VFEETFAEAWEKRFGEKPKVVAPQIERLLTHRSVRHYSDRPVPEEMAAALVGAAQSAATSSNLQLWSVVSVQDPERREAMARLCDNQHQVREAAWFFAFLVDHHRIRSAAARVAEAAEGLDYTEFFAMGVIDAALAAERMVCAAEILGLGICYIGALRNDPEGVADLLELPDGTFGCFGLCIGWPAEDARAEIKPRLRSESIWFRERYPAQVDVSEYDERMKGFYESQRMKGDVTWSMRSGRRADNHHLTGREVLFEWLRSRGFLRR
jgi:nitroreductase